MVFFHIDLDAFFASVEILDHPEYKGKPLIIGSRSERSVVSTCSYEARKYGVHSTMPVMKAKQLCPQGIFISQKKLEEFPDIDYRPTGSWIRSKNVSYNDTIVEEVNQIQGVSYAMTIQTMREKCNDVISSIKLMTLTIKIFAILLAIVVLYNLALLNFNERIKDIATLKVLGFSKLEIGSSFICEILILTFIGALVGLIFGKPLLVAVLSINENPMLSYIYHVKGLSYISTILLTCGVSLIINLFFALLTSKVKMVESLKSVE